MPAAALLFRTTKGKSTAAEHTRTHTHTRSKRQVQGQGCPGGRKGRPPYKGCTCPDSGLTFQARQQAQGLMQQPRGWKATTSFPRSPTLAILRPPHTHTPGLQPRDADQEEADPSLGRASKKLSDFPAAAQDRRWATGAGSVGAQGREPLNPHPTSPSCIGILDPRGNSICRPDTLPLSLLPCQWAGSEMELSLPRPGSPCRDR